MTRRITSLLETVEYVEIPREYSGIRVFYLPDLSAYLKIGEIAKNSQLDNERKALSWLSGKLAAPQLLDFDTDGDVEYILISEIVGKQYSELETDREIGGSEVLIEEIAGQIRKMHDLSIANCPLDQRLAKKMDKALANIHAGFVDESDFDTENIGKSADEVYAELAQLHPADEDLVFTHGDLCLPNIIIQDGRLSGFIDLDRAGVADRYQDIALFLRSFDLNFEGTSDLVESFQRGYGIDAIDRTKMHFYRTLDELF